MALWLLISFALLGFSTTQPSVQEPSLPWLHALSLNSSVEAMDAMQIPSNGSAPLLVRAFVFVANVFNVDILRYTVSSVLVLRLSWLDDRLAWNASAHSRRAVTLPRDSLWTPELTIREALWVDWKDPSPQARVKQDGQVELNLALTTETNCDFELLRFPRDESDCSLSFYALSNTETELEFQAQAVNEIVSVKREYVVLGVKTQVIPHHQVPSFQVMLSLKNTALKSIIALLVPAEALQLADVCGGLLPLQATERIGYKVTLLLSSLVFHSSLVQGLPSSSSCNPLLIHYFTVLQLLLFLSTTETVLLAGVLARQSREDKGITSPGPQGEPRDKDDPGPDPAATPKRGKGSRRSWAVAADHTFFLVYVASVVCSQVIFAGIWMWATCKSAPPPGEGVPHGGHRP